jgi:UDP-N-acetylglucosamine 2-epimerase (non-hydrolysing)
MLICNVVGARPNFMKLAPVMKEIEKRSIKQILLHTGQHYDDKMSQVFFDELELPHPDIYLEAGSDTYTRQISKIMIGFENVCIAKKPDLVIVSGDVNSTLATTLVCSNLKIPVAHIESGLRSFDRNMPEEINRIVTDYLSDLLFTTEQSANENLKKEGISEDKIYFVGNCMIDSLYKYLQKAISKQPWLDFKLTPYEYAILTLHRTSNVDNHETLIRLSSIVNEISTYLPIVFPMHPRVSKNIKLCDIHFRKDVRLCEPLSYLNFIGLLAKTKFVLTDSGGIQEETTAINVPCLTLRENTERPSTVALGTNRIVGTDRNKIVVSVNEILDGKFCKGNLPPLWDGNAAKRVVDTIESWWDKLGDI